MPVITASTRRIALVSSILAGLASPAWAQFANVNPVAVSPPPAPFTSIPSQTPGPGSITVRLNARVNVYFYTGADSGRNTTVTPSGSNGQSNTKLAGYGMGSYARLYPGFDGVAGNGLKYGAALEIRQDQASPPGGGINGSVSASNRSRGALYFRREMAYVGADNYGFVRYGATDQPTALFATGLFENVSDNGWNGDVLNFFTSNTQLTWPFPDVGALYTTEKVVYLSPRWQGFDFGVSFEPNTGTVNGGPGNCPYNYTSSTGLTGPLNQGNGTGCDAATSTSSGDITRRRNTVDGALRYRGAFGPVGVVVTAGGMLSGSVADNATPARQPYNGLSVFDSGMQLTYGGLAVGGHITTGESNGQFNLQQKGQINSFAWLVGGSYAIGPIVFGGSYYNFSSAGSKTFSSAPTVGNRREQGVYIGGTYSFAPGMNVFLTYLYGTRSQGGIDLLSGAASSATSRVVTHNNVQAQGFGIGTQFRW